MRDRMLSYDVSRMTHVLSDRRERSADFWVQCSMAERGEVGCQSEGREDGRGSEVGVRACERMSGWVRRPWRGEVGRSG